MIIVALLGALVFYVALYCIWAASSQHLNSVEAWLRMLNNMLWVPGPLIFTLLRGLILATALYVFCDWLLSSVKRLKRKSREAKIAREEPFAVGTKHPPPS